MNDSNKENIKARGNKTAGMKNVRESLAKKKRGRPRKVLPVIIVEESSPVKEERNDEAGFGENVELTEHCIEHVHQNTSEASAFPQESAAPKITSKHVLDSLMMLQEDVESCEDSENAEDAIVDVEASQSSSGGQQQNFAELKTCDVENNSKPQGNNQEIHAQKSNYENVSACYAAIPANSEYYEEHYMPNQGMGYPARAPNCPNVYYQQMPDPSMFYPHMYNRGIQQIVYAEQPGRKGFSNKPSKFPSAPDNADNNSQDSDCTEIIHCSSDDSDSCLLSDEEGSSSKTKGRGKKQKIKRPMNAFMVWAKKNRPKYSRKYPDMTNSLISVRLGELWSKMSKEHKRPYFEEAKKIKEQHKKDHPGWTYQPRARRQKPKNPGVTRIYAVTETPMGAPIVRQVNNLGQLPRDVMMSANMQLPPRHMEQYMTQQGPHNLSPAPYVFGPPGQMPPAGFCDQNRNMQYPGFSQQAMFSNSMQHPQRCAFPKAPVCSSSQYTESNKEEQTSTPKTISATNSTSEPSRTRKRKCNETTQVKEGSENICEQGEPVANVVSLATMSKTKNSAPETQQKMPNTGESLQEAKSDSNQKTCLPNLRSILQKRDIITSVENKS